MNAPSPTVTIALIGSIWDTVVSGVDEARTNEIAHLVIGEPGQSIDRRDDFRVAEIELSCFHRRFVGFNVRFARIARPQSQCLAPDR